VYVKTPTINFSLKSTRQSGGARSQTRWVVSHATGPASICLLGETWEPQFRASDVTRNLVHLYTIAIEVLQEQPQ